MSKPIVAYLNDNKEPLRAYIGKDQKPLSVEMNNLSVMTGISWGKITGEIEDQTDLVEYVADNATKDYNILENKPSIDDTILIGNRTLSQIGVKTLSVQEIEKILYLD